MDLYIGQKILWKGELASSFGFLFSFLAHLQYTNQNLRNVMITFTFLGFAFHLGLWRRMGCLAVITISFQPIILGDIDHAGSTESIRARILPRGIIVWMQLPRAAAHLPINIQLFGVETWNMAPQLYGPITVSGVAWMEHSNLGAHRTTDCRA